LAATNERDLYFRAAERAFYRNPFSDLLILSRENYSKGAEGEWKSVNLPVLLVDSAGMVPEATRREIGRRKKANLFIWGDRECIPKETVSELQSITEGRVFRITAESQEEHTQVQQLMLGVTEIPLTPRENFYNQGPADFQEAPPGTVPAREFYQVPLPGTVPAREDYQEPLPGMVPAKEDYQEPPDQQEASQCLDSPVIALTDTPQGQEENYEEQVYAADYPGALPSQEALPEATEESTGPGLSLEPLPGPPGLEMVDSGEHNHHGTENMVLAPELAAPPEESAEGFSLEEKPPEEITENYSFIKENSPGESPKDYSFEEIIPPRESNESHSFNEAVTPEKGTESYSFDKFAPQGQNADNYGTGNYDAESYSPENYNMEEATTPQENTEQKAEAKEYSLNGKKIAVWRLPV